MKKIALLSLVLLCITSNGCMMSKSSVSDAQTVDSKVDYNGIPRYLGVSGLGQKRENSLLVGFVEVTNKDAADRTAYYRVRWLDESGLPAWEDETWKPLLFHGDQKQTLKVIAPTVKAKDFKIEFSAEDNFRK